MKEALVREIVEILMESELYFDLSLAERQLLINKIKDFYHLETADETYPDVLDNSLSH